ncbi:putative 2og-fe oxygenase family [Diaporthe ampelina]|uniref:Putative 2og-fe oxygenase family n=1 Tax=Diaporthe ampelina TaxID=1214573 RepID=A0A0G2FKQ3_9PEZI|nr:putative 2og-fe oxygenase family [Diaporthe ampelina]
MSPSSQPPSSFHIPTIDIGPYLEDASTDAARGVVDDVRNACMTAGFFSLVGHGIPREMQDGVLRAARRFFDLPLPDKTALRHPLIKNRGYEVIGSQTLQEDALPDLKEGFYIGKDLPLESDKVKAHPELLGQNMFPATLPDGDFRLPTERYYAAVLDLSMRVLEILAKGLPYGDDIFHEFVSNDPVCIMRLLHYPPQAQPPPPSRDQRQLGAGAHTDFGAITLLLQDSSGGLQVQDPHTQSWHAVAPNPDAYVVNIGDMLALWTKGIYRSAVHRVINSSGGHRYSVPFFFDGNAEAKLRPFDGSEPVGGRVVTVEEHMLQRLGASYRGGGGGGGGGGVGRGAAGRAVSASA